MLFKKILLRTTLSLLVLSAICLVSGWLWLKQSLPKLDGEIITQSLEAPVLIATDPYGIAVINAESRLDAIRALGFISARDRLFQMDLMRRKNAGRLSEIFGAITVDSDARVRTFDFNAVAKLALLKLPKAHLAYLQAYAEGVNNYLAQAKHLAFEFTLLNYRPEAWKPEDSLLIVLGMYDMLTSGSEEEERMLSIMEKALPNDVFAFLTPDTDIYTDSLYPNDPSWRPIQKIPTANLSKTLAPDLKQALTLEHTFKDRDLVLGSNAWAVAGTKTKDGRALLANDMHLGLSVPNIWYRAELNYSNTHVAGVVLPGTPLIIAGSNEQISWGVTNLTGDFLDLVTLEINPSDPEKYKAGQAWLRFGRRKELILVKDKPPVELDIKTTLWGPVSPQQLLEKPVAIHWTALDADAVNIGMADLEQTQTLASAIAVAHAVGGPQLNALFADANGNIAWTILGKLPNRVGLDGATSRSWADTDAIGWQGYVAEHEIPKVLNPAEGILVSANDRRLGKSFPNIIGHQFVPGYRAYRISQRLKEMTELNEWSLFSLQLDTEAEFYAFYHQLALEVLSPKAIENKPELREIRAYLLAWHGNADTSSLGFALLQGFREQLANAVLTPYLASCKQLDKNFQYAWLYVDTPLKMLLTQKITALIPSDQYNDWDSFILAQLEASAIELKTTHKDIQLADLRWGQINHAKIYHPIFGNIPWLGALLNMPEAELAGCGGCIRAAGANFGASERMVISPQHSKDGILQMPTGQSAHPLSQNYQDQQRFWLSGTPMDFLAGKAEHKLTLVPDFKQP
ncbi:MAG: penicillin acylase family protein [Methylococcaceae bacterium]|jgi:penicillin amidase